MSKVLKKTKFKCEFCKREFQTFSGLSDHSDGCELRKRKLLENTEEANLAHKLWEISFKGTRRKNYSYDCFINHRDYKLFTNFSTFCCKIKSLDPEQYMNWCIKERIKLKLWTSELVYERFIKYYLVHEDPLDAVLRSINYIKSLGINNYFTTIELGTFLTSLEMGRISPWLYLLYWNSTAILKRMNEDHLKRLNLIIDGNVWSILQKKHWQICSDIKKTLKKEIL